jgi:hypothetical protein
MSRPELFDMAVNRAIGYAERLGALEGTRDRKVLHDVLELWYLKTRFAYRIPLDEVVEVLMGYPGGGHHWEGGKDGGWREGDTPRP